MWRSLVLAAALGVPVACAAQAPLDPAVWESQLAKSRAWQDKRIQALSRRGRLDDYRDVLQAGSVRRTGPFTDVGGRSFALTAAQLAQRDESATRASAIELAAAGFTAADVAAYRRRGIDLLAIAGGPIRSLADQMLMADTVVIATAGELETGRKRVDGFLSATPFTVVESLKGSRAPGDIVRTPRQSGPTGNGTELWVSSDIQATPGTTYLLVLSRNQYEQLMAEAGHGTQSGFNALIYCVYEVTSDGGLRPGPMHMRGFAGKDPKDIASVRRDLAKYSPARPHARGR